MHTSSAHRRVHFAPFGLRSCPLNISPDPTYKESSFETAGWLFLRVRDDSVDGNKEQYSLIKGRYNEVKTEAFYPTSRHESQLEDGQSHDLTGKIALVTGGDTGMSREQQGQAAEEKFGGAGHLVPLQVDVTVKENILSVVDHVKKSDGKLDILVNKSALPTPIFLRSVAWNIHTPPFRHPVFRRLGLACREYYVASYFFVTMAFVDLVESTQGKEGATASVINITSGAGQIRLSFGYFTYASLKAGTSHLAHLLATDFALKCAPIRVNAITPGTFSSQLFAPQEQPDEYCKTNMGCLEPIPARRSGREHEMAALVVYLASPASGYTHRQEIFIDGGLLPVNP
ncbi:hypothetical protein ACEPAG_4513 [Sanghuangporus baumii]